MVLRPLVLFKFSLLQAFSEMAKTQNPVPTPVTSQKPPQCKAVCSFEGRVRYTAAY